MPSSQRTYWSIVGVSCLLIIVIVLIILWPYRELIGFLVVGLGVLAAVVTLVLHIVRTWTDVIVKLHEQKLRQERLRPNDDGYYEIPLDGGKSPISPPNWEGQKPYSQGYDPKDSSNKGWD
jgi:heme exporter protein D